MKWIQTVAAWAPLEARQIPTPKTFVVLGRLELELEKLGAVPITKTSLAYVRRSGPYPLHVDGVTYRDAEAAILAECRAIVLRFPNPFPTIRLFRWLP